MNYKIWVRAFSLFLLSAVELLGNNYTVTEPGDNALPWGTGSLCGKKGDLRYCINQANKHPCSSMITLAPNLGTITLNDALPILNWGGTSSSTFTIEGNNNVIDGNGKFRPFFVSQGAVNIQNIQIQNGVAQGGAGSGGGMGSGGAIFVRQHPSYPTNLTLQNVEITNAVAHGGDGAFGSESKGYAGGGMGGRGGASYFESKTGGGGGGGVGAFGDGGSSKKHYYGGGGGGGYSAGETYSGSGGSNKVEAESGGLGLLAIFCPFPAGKGGGGCGAEPGGHHGGGGGAGQSYVKDHHSYVSYGGGAGGYKGGAGSYAGGSGSTVYNIGGGGGGGAGYSSKRHYGGSGGFGGGGGTPGGSGGFGGGGAATYGADFVAGSGGFGGGGGGGYLGANAGIGGIGGGQGSSSGGGGGAGFGGALFVMNGATVSILDGVKVTGCSTVAGLPGSSKGGAGATGGSDIFAMTGAHLMFAPSVGSAVVLGESMGDDSKETLPGGSYTPGSGKGAGVTVGISGQQTGSVQFLGQHTYSGGTTILSGTLALQNAGALLRTGAVSLQGLDVTSGATFDISGHTGAVTIGPFSGNSFDAVHLGANTLTTNTNKTTTFDGVISDVGGFNLAGGGQLTLRNTNTYAGATNIADSTLVLGVKGGSSGSVQGAVSLAGTPGNGGVFDISGLNSGTTIGALSGNSSDQVKLGPNTLTTQCQGSSTFGGVISDEGGLTVGGEGALTLSGSNTYQGATTIEGAATLALEGMGLIPNTPLIQLSGSLGRPATFDISGVMLGTPVAVGVLEGGASDFVVLGGNALATTFTGTATFNGTISGSGGSLIKSGSGTFFLGGSSTYSGGTTLNSGILNIGSDSALGSGTLAVGNQTTLQAGSPSITAHQNIEMGAGVAFTVDTQENALTCAGNISGDGSHLVKVGSGTLYLTGSNTNKGPVTINEGTLALGSPSIHTGSWSGPIVFGGTGIFDISNLEAEVTVAALDGTSSNAVILGSNTLVTDVAGSSTFDGIISGSGGHLTKSGSGTFYLGGDNTYTGGTTISGGTLNITGAYSLGSGVISASGEATLQIRSSTAFSQDLFIDSDTTLTLDTQGKTLSCFGNIAGGNAFSNLTKAGGGTLYLSGNNTFAGVTTVDGGTLALGSPFIHTGSLASAISLTGTGIFDISNLEASAAVGALSGTANSVVNLGGNTLILNSAKNTNFEGVIKGSGALILEGGEQFKITNVNTYTGGTTVINSALFLEGRGSLYFQGSLTLMGDANNIATFDIAQGKSTTIGDLSGNAYSSIVLGSNKLRAGTDNDSVFGGVISGDSHFTKVGSGTLYLTGSNTNQGPLTIDEGTLALGSPSIHTGSWSGSIEFRGTGVFDISNLEAGVTVGALDGSPSNAVKLGSNTLITNVAGSSTFNGVISGSGGHITKSGSGTFYLGGESTYTGGTTISGGTLNIAKASALGSGEISARGIATLQIGASTTLSQDLFIDSDTTLTLDTQGNTLSYFGNIAGGNTFSNLTKAGSGALYLTGDNTYAGVTTIDAGVLALGTSSIHTGSLAGAISITGTGVFDISNLRASETVGALSGTANSFVNLGANTLILNSAENTNFNGVIRGAGALALEGGGIFRINNVNTYTGGTTVTNSTLSLESTCSLYSGGSVRLMGEASTPALFDIAEGRSMTIGDLSGNAYSSVNLGNNNLITETDNSTTFNGVFRGSGTLIKEGGGTLRLGGLMEGFGGSMQVNGGILEGTTESLTTDIVVGPNASVIFNQATTGYYNDFITGTGTVQVMGGGLVYFTNAESQIDGSTVVSNGSLSIEGTINQDVTLGMIGGRTGILEGTGTVNGPIVLIGGSMISPGVPGIDFGLQGGEAKTLTIGSAEFGGGSIFEVTINPSNVVVSLVCTAPAGVTVMPGANLKIDIAEGEYTVPKTYTIITATGDSTITNGEAFTINAPAGYDFSLSSFLDENSNGTTLNLTLFGVPNRLSFTKLLPTQGLKGNNLIVANYLNLKATDDAIAEIVTSLSSLSFHDLNEALSTIDPARNAFGPFTLQNTAFVFSQVVTSRQNDQRLLRRKKDAPLIAGPIMQSPPPKKEETYSVWGSLLGSFAREKEQKQTPEFNMNVGGVLFGYDNYKFDNALIGAAVGYAYIDIHEKNHYGNQYINDVVLSTYTSLSCGNCYFDLALWGGYHKGTSKRNIFFPQYSEVAKADTQGWQVVPHFQFGYDHVMKSITLQPFVQFDWAFNFEDSLKEKGATALSMRQKAHTSSFLRSEVGFATTQTYLGSKGQKFIMREHLSYVNKQLFKTGRVTASIVGLPGGTFAVETLTADQNLIAPGIEFFYETRGHTFFSLSYEGEFGSKYMSNNAIFKMGKAF